jgi:putative ABC transport system permease protein
MFGLLFDLRQAVRSLKKSAGVTLVVALTLALGIGATTAIFTVFDAVLLRPLRFEEPERLVRITADLVGSRLDDVGLSLLELEDYRALPDSLEEISGLFPININLTDVDQPERIDALLVDVNYFSILGVGAQVGRVFRDEDYRLGIAEVAVISDVLWRRRFGGDPDVIGRKFRLDEDLFAIVGVAPPGFRHPGREATEIWVPAGWRDTPFPNPPIRRAYFLNGAIARLKPGVTASTAEARLLALASELRRQNPNDYPEASGWSPRVIPLQHDLVGNVRPLLLLLLAAVSVILLMVCANVASLLLARGASRQRELALRRALGASGRALTRQLLVESLLLGLIGGALGFLVASFGLEVLVRASPETFPRLSEIAIDGRILAFAALISIGAGLLFGTAPALQASRVSLLSGLKGASEGAVGAPSRGRSALVVLEYSLAIVVLVTAVLLGRSLWRLANVELGFEPDSLVTARVWLPQPNNPEDGPYFEHGPRALLVRDLSARISTLPGVDDAALSSLLPLDGQRPIRPFEIQGHLREGDETLSSMFSSVTSPYFDVMRIPLRRGRFFGDGDDERSRPVAIVSESFAELHFPGEDPVGAQIRLGGFRGRETPWRTIVGVVSDVKVEGLELAPRPHMYTPLLQESGLSLAFVVRTRSPLAELAESLRQAVRGADPDLPLYAPRTMEDLVAQSLGERRFATWLAGAFSLAALVLSGLGVYGLTSYSVRTRTREFGIRMALGAQPRRLLRLVLRQGLALFAVGASIGLFAAALTASILRSLLFEIGANDPPTYVLVTVLLGVSALAASCLPARRAARVDPLRALRHE